ncbi:MAG: DUF58 domain-containing protein [Candidatus Wallbacteria bacterium]|nr:DUF58 domain-containing protein [Candidatus Wallbacteria bacterium]
MLQVEEIFKKIRKIDIKARKLVSETFLGTYHSRFKGRGIEFSEVTDYHYGDDIKTIDWNVTARQGNPYVKKYMEERELCINIMIDISGSQNYGSGKYSKRELAAEIAGVIAFSAVRNNDKAGLVLVSDNVEYYLPPGKGYQHLFRIIREALFFEPKSPGTNLSPGLEYISSIYHRRQIVFVISDFFGYIPDKNWLTTMRRHELIPVVIEDIREGTLAPSGILEIEDLETGENFQLSLPAAHGLWRQTFEQKRSSLFEEFRKIGQNHLVIRNDEEIVSRMQEFFEARKN